MNCNGIVVRIRAALGAARAGFMNKLVTCSIGCFIGIVFGGIVAQNLASMTLEDLHDRSCRIVCEASQPPKHQRSAYMAAFGAGAFTAWSFGIFSIIVARKLVPKNMTADVVRPQTQPPGGGGASVRWRSIVEALRREKEHKDSMWWIRLWEALAPSALVVIGR